MEAVTIQRYMHTSPRKLRLVSDMVRDMEPEKALNMLSFTRKNASLDLIKAIKTALGNAKVKGMDTEKVIFKSVEINESVRMKRFKAGTRGRAKPFKRRMAHIKIVLTDDLKGKKEVLP